MDDKDELSLGDLVIVSQSAHIYEDCWEPAMEIVKAHRKPAIWHDEKGQWIMEFPVRGSDEIEMALCDPNGLVILELKGTPEQLVREIRDRRLVSDVGHALWLGMQVGRYLKSKPSPKTLVAGGETFPTECPKECPGLKELQSQGGLCHRCPIFSCTPTEDGIRLLAPADYRADWAKEWRAWFDSGMKDYPVLKLFPPKE
jgi:hypothetical protein